MKGFMNAEHLLAVAIHFSMESTRLTTCTSVNYQNDPSKILCKVWKTIDDYYSESVPPNILIKPDGKTINGYGYEAEKLYEEMKEEYDYKQYYYFKDITLRLSKTYKEAEDFQLKDENGKILPALTVFTLVIEYIKADLQENKMNLIEEQDKYYVLIVPEMFQQIGAIDFMRKAAIEAGINVQSLSVVTEIDAVSVFHQREISKRTHNKKSITGKRFMVVNTGGYSTSIVVHESTNAGTVKENTVLETRVGGHKLLKKAFKKLFTDVFGKDTFTTFISESKREWLEMKTYFLLKILALKPSSKEIFRLRLHANLLQKVKDDVCSDESSNRLKNISVCSDKICFPSEYVQTLIDKSVTQVISDIQAIMEKVDVEEIVVFGEFSKSPIFKHGIVKEISGKSVIFHDDETNSALKGAVIIGLGLGQIEKIDRARDTAIVAAIDFGTTYSGWAYSLRTNFVSDPTKASTKLWNSGTSQTEKTPTCILIGQDGKTVEAFGYDAEDRYQELADTEEHGSYYYFRRFKMALKKKLGEKLDRNMTLEDVINRSLPALDVFTLSIKYLKDDLLGELQNAYLGSISMDDIHWVLTVPAIWTDGSKQFMREAAIKAGIKSKRLTIALEPEAASMYCRSLSIEATQRNMDVNISSLSVGTQYMILDAGGGTVDITVHEICPENSIKEIHAACGGGWGGTIVDEEFRNFLIDIVTEEVYEKFKLDHTDDWLELLREFEVKKRTVTIASTKAIRMKLPLSLTETYYTIAKRKISDFVKSTKYTNDIQIVRDKINISAELVRSWFTCSVDKTVKMVKSIISRNPSISAILMVGGFSESKVLQDAVRSAFNKIDVIVPVEASTCILKGALIFGHLPKVVTERVLKCTYGIGSFEEYMPEKHPEKNRITTDKGEVCKNIFSKHAEVDQRVKVGEPQVWHTYSPQYKSQKQMAFSVYASVRPNPMYTDVDCTLIGKLLIDLDDHDGALDREILVAFTFSGTEIVVEAKDKKTENRSFVALDFLG